MARQQAVNGIDVGRLGKLIDELGEQPRLARFQFRAHHEWIDGAHARTIIRDFYGAGEEDRSRKRPFVIEADEPDILLGEDHGPNATEALLHALAACLGATFIYNAAAKGIEIEDLTLDLEGDIDMRGLLGITRDVRRGFEQIRATFHVRADASYEQLEELTRLAQMRSPVFDIVTNPTPVEVRLQAG